MSTVLVSSSNNISGFSDIFALLVEDVRQSRGETALLTESSPLPACRMSLADKAAHRSNLPLPLPPLVPPNTRLETQLLSRRAAPVLLLEIL